MSKKVDFSIVSKISRWHFGEMFFHFLAINIALIVFFSIAMIAAGENHIEKLMLNGEESYSEMSSAEPSGVMIPFTKEKDFIRAVIFRQDTGNWWNSALTYRIWAPYGDGYAAYDYDFGETAMLSLKFFIALAILELLLSLDGIKKSRFMARSALRPLTELAETAQNIDKRSAQPDISEAQLRDLAEKLEQANESYDSQVRFVSDASHELRTPIAVIQGYANLLDRWGKNDEKVLQESIDAIKSEAQNMKDLVEQLLFLARGDNDSMRLNIERMNISAIVSEVASETRMIAASHAVALSTEDEVYILGDAQLMKQALRILIDNSLKYTPEKESIKITLCTEGDKVKISVSDNGIGITPEDLPHIFDRFFRSDDSRTRKTGGGGLGLSIAKWIIERHGGSLEVTSRKDIGTRVTMTFDAVKDD